MRRPALDKARGERLDRKETGVLVYHFFWMVVRTIIENKVGMLKSLIAVVAGMAGLDEAFVLSFGTPRVVVCLSPVSSLVFILGAWDMFTMLGLLSDTDDV